jgi:hypothetical protein
VTGQLSLLSPQNRRTVPYRCPECDTMHTTSVPATWTGRRRIWTHCAAKPLRPIAVDIDCTEEAA